MTKSKQEICNHHNRLIRWEIYFIYFIYLLQVSKSLIDQTGSNLEELFSYKGISLWRFYQTKAQPFKYAVMEIYLFSRNVWITSWHFKWYSCILVMKWYSHTCINLDFINNTSGNTSLHGTCSHLIPLSTVHVYFEWKSWPWLSLQWLKLQVSICYGNIFHLMTMN